MLYYILCYHATSYCAMEDAESSGLTPSRRRLSSTNNTNTTKNTTNHNDNDDNNSNNKKTNDTISERGLARPCGRSPRRLFLFAAPPGGGLGVALCRFADGVGAPDPNPEHLVHWCL